MGGERDYGSQYEDRNRSRSFKFEGGSKKLEKQPPVWIEKPHLRVDEDYYQWGTMTRIADKVLARPRPFEIDNTTTKQPSTQPSSVPQSKQIERESQGTLNRESKSSTSGLNKTPATPDNKIQNKQAHKPQSANSPPKKQNWLQRMFGGDRQQEPSPEQIEAKKQFDSYSVPGLQPDVYISQLQLQRQIAQKNGANPKQLKQIDEAIANAEELLGITEQTPQGTAIPLTATLTTTADPQTVPLQLYLKPAEDGGWEIVDLTNPDKGSARTYRGSVRRSGRQADDVTGEAAKQLAIDRAWENYVKNNPHPEGELVADFSLNKEAGSNIKQGHSTGISELQQVKQWASRVGLVTGVVGLGMLLTPGLQGGGALLLTSAVAGGVAGGSGILDRSLHGNFQWDAQTFLDLTDIAAGLAVGAGAAIKVGAKSAQITQLGKNTVLISEGVETGTDVAAGTIISAQHYRRIEEIRSSNLPEDQKQAQIQQELASAAATGGLLLIGGVATTKGRKGDFLDVSPDGIGTSARPGNNGIKITAENLEEFRSIGFSKADLDKLNNPNITKAEKNALYARRDANYKQLYSAYGQEGIEQLSQKLGAKGLRQIYGATGVDGLKKVEQIIELERQGKVKNFDDWMEFLNSGNRGDQGIKEVVGELDVTKGVGTSLGKNEVINLGGDNQAVTNAQGEKSKSFDLAIEDNQTGELLRNIEVHRPRNTRLATNHSDFGDGISHAIEKATLKVKDAQGNTVIDTNIDRPKLIPNPEIKGKVEAAININIPEAGTVVGKKGKERFFGESGTYGTYYQPGNDLYQDIINEQLTNVDNLNPYPEKYLDRVHIIDRNGTLRATIEKTGTAKTGYSWTIKRYR